MEWQWVIASAARLSINLIYAVVALFVGVLALRIIDTVVLRKIDLEEEIRKGNLAAALFASVLVLFTGVILAFALSK